MLFLRKAHSTEHPSRGCPHLVLISQLSRLKLLRGFEPSTSVSRNRHSNQTTNMLQVDTSTRQRGFEIRVFLLPGVLPKAIAPHLPSCQLYRWQLGPNMWSSPTTMSCDPIVVTTLRVGFPGESHRPATCGFVCNCPQPELWTTEVSGQCWGYYSILGIGVSPW